LADAPVQNIAVSGGEIGGTLNFAKQNPWIVAGLVILGLYIWSRWNTPKFDALKSLALKLLGLLVQHPDKRAEIEAAHVAMSDEFARVREDLEQMAIPQIPPDPAQVPAIQAMATWEAAEGVYRVWLAAASVGAFVASIPSAVADAYMTFTPIGILIKSVPSWKRKYRAKRRAVRKAIQHGIAATIATVDHAISEFGQTYLTPLGVQQNPTANAIEHSYNDSISSSYTLNLGVAGQIVSITPEGVIVTYEAAPNIELTPASIEAYGAWSQAVMAEGPGNPFWTESGPRLDIQAWLRDPSLSGGT